MKITAIGQATYYIRDGSLSVLTDPWFSTDGLSAFLAPRLVGPALQADQIENCSLILLSHMHIDHWDRQAARLAARCKSTIVTAADAARRLKKAGLNVVGLTAGESFSGLDVTVEAVKAEHPLSPGAIGLVLNGRKKVYFSGDTLDHRGLDKLAGYNLDLALLQSSCARYPFLGPDGMDWPAAVSLVRRIRPRIFIPMHFTCRGKYLDLGQKVRIENSKMVKEYLSRGEKELAAEGIDCRILWPGETREI
jgi:L-ascorbate metabolism protein UlaG (beta-lactamase superfamily)